MTWAAARATLRQIRRVRTPTVLQMEATECGAACLAMVLAHHGRRVPLEQLRQDCGVSRDGSKATNILKAARRHGMAARAFKKETKQLAALDLPAIIFWNFNHFVVLDSIDARGARLNDPAVGQRIVTPEEFDESFTGVVLTFSPTAEFEKGGKGRSFARSVIDRLAGAGGALIFAMVSSAGLVVPGLAAAAFTGIFVDQVLIQRLDSWRAPLLLTMLGVAAIAAGLTFLQQHILARLRFHMTLGGSATFIWRVLRLPVAYFAQRYPIEVAGRNVLNDRIATLFAGDLATTLLNMLAMVIYAIAMAQYDLVLTAIGVCFALANLACLWLSAQSVMQVSRRLQIDSAMLYAVTAGGFTTLDSLKASGAESLFMSRWSGFQAKVLNAEQTLGRLQAALGVVPYGLGTVAIVAIIVVGGVRVMDGVLTIGMLVGFQTLMAAFSEPVMQLVGFGNEIQQTRIDVERLDDVLRQELDPGFQRRPEHEAIPTQLGGGMRIDGLAYGYSPLDPPLIADFSLDLQPGARVALVGRSGSGKSTVGKLIAGLYTPWGGDILLDGMRIEQTPRATLRHSVAYVDQNTALFPGTIRDNISLWDPTLPDERIVAAAQDAMIHPDIAARPNGYDHAVEEGGRNFSGGQRQRIIMARALALEPSLMVFDEATSALDAATEFRIMERLRRRGCSCVIVAHRLSTVRDCDEIIVLDRGAIVERGTHAALMAANGHYRALVES
jgi:NHLM bacteriocin system ABC transporter peptidase/ATP-binding protein